MCAAVDRLRPATSAEALAMQFAQNAKCEPGPPEDQQAFVDARASLNRDEDELVDDSLENRPVLDTNDPETPQTRPRSSEELLNDGPIASVAVLRYLLSNWISRLESYGQIREPRLAITGTAVGTAEPRIELVERLQDRERDEANALIAFYTDRCVGCKYRPKKKGKKSRNINF